MPRSGSRKPLSLVAFWWYDLLHTVAAMILCMPQGKRFPWNYQQRSYLRMGALTRQLWKLGTGPSREVKTRWPLGGADCLYVRRQFSSHFSRQTHSPLYLSEPLSTALPIFSLLSNHGDIRRISASRRRTALRQPYFQQISHNWVSRLCVKQRKLQISQPDKGFGYSGFHRFCGFDCFSPRHPSGVSSTTGTSGADVP